jgi:hypothetical protein
MKRYEVLFMDGHTEILDFESVDHLIDELESFERFDVNQIHELEDDDSLGQTVWTEEEGCFVPDFGYPTRDDVDDEDDDEF